jgi:protein phosphatase methylesterase 1
MEHWDEQLTVAPPASNVAFRAYVAGDTGPTLLLLHGAGQSALVWSLVAQRLRGKARVVAFDQRAHGASGGSESDLGAAQLVDDAVGVANQVRADLGVALDSPIMLVGHSMGGAIVARAGASGRIAGLCGVAVVDVVEGTAIAALQHMHAVLARRPASFLRPGDAVAWTVHSGGVRSTLSATLSVPSQLVRRAPVADDASTAWTWRTNLAATETHWRGWFEGLSATFLACPVAKLLVLAGTDRLDKPLMIAQMQGKFQLVIVADCGHAVHEEQPDTVAHKLIDFLARQGLCEGTGGGRGGPSALYPGSRGAAARPGETLVEKLARARAIKRGGR